MEVGRAVIMGSSGLISTKTTQLLRQEGRIAYLGTTRTNVTNNGAGPNGGGREAI